MADLNPLQWTKHTSIVVFAATIVYGAIMAYANGQSNEIRISKLETRQEEQDRETATIRETIAEMRGEVKFIYDVVRKHNP